MYAIASFVLYTQEFGPPHTVLPTASILRVEVLASLEALPHRNGRHESIDNRDGTVRTREFVPACGYRGTQCADSTIADVNIRLAAPSEGVPRAPFGQSTVAMGNEAQSVVAQSLSPSDKTRTFLPAGSCTCRSTTTSSRCRARVAPLADLVRKSTSWISVVSMEYGWAEVRKPTVLFGHRRWYRTSKGVLETIVTT